MKTEQTENLTLKPSPPKEEDTVKKSHDLIIENTKKIRGILNKYNRQIGYNQKYHARSDAQTQMNEILCLYPENTREKIRRKASHDETASRKKTFDKTIDYSELIEKSTKRTIPRNLSPLTVKNRKQSEALESKFQNIFNENMQYTPSTHADSLYFLRRVKHKKESDEERYTKRDCFTGKA